MFNNVILYSIIYTCGVSRSTAPDLDITCKYRHSTSSSAMSKSKSTNNCYTCEN